MKPFLICLAIIGWVDLVIHAMEARTVVIVAGNMRSLIDRAHSGDGSVCPVHGPGCRRAVEAGQKKVAGNGAL